MTLAVGLAACGGGSDDSSAPGGSPTPTDTGTGLNEKSCPLQYALTGPSTASGTDPLFSAQWHLRNTGQQGGTPGVDIRAPQAWSLTRGEGVRVAVIDDAVEVLHQDLLPNIVPGASFNYRPDRRGNAYPLPCRNNDDHGTAVAGLVAARDDNALGVAGVAPRVNLVGYNALATSFDSDIADSLTRDLASTGVYHNSWGAPDDGRLATAESIFVDAINRGITEGRQGKGAIYVFPAGNGGCYGRDRNTGACLYSDNSNYDGYVNKRGIITACAIDINGRQPRYGEPGANILVCGYSSNDTVGVTTTAIGNGYRNDFSGTSASTPMVSGVAALLLAENPALTWRDVQQILARSARRNDPTDPEWVDAFGLHFNPKYGFGAADAEAALALARTWNSIGGTESQLRCGPFRSSPNIAIPDAGTVGGATVSDTIDVSNCGIGNIEFVEIRLTTRHEYSGDLRIAMISPNGLVSPLANRRLCSGVSGADNCGAYNDWPFGSVRHLDEAANGAWRIEITDADPTATGTFVSWALTFYGR